MGTRALLQNWFGCTVQNIANVLVRVTKSHSRRLTFINSGLISKKTFEKKTHSKNKKIYKGKYRKC